jgi:hypothetical protein
MRDMALSQLKDIMPRVEILIDSLPLMATLVLLLVLPAAFLLRRYRKNRQKPTPQTEALHLLKQLDFQGEVDRELLYQFTLYTYTYLNKREDLEFEKIQQALLPYKYHPDAPPVERALIQNIRSYIMGLS